MYQQQQYLRGVQEMLMQQMAASAAANGGTNAGHHQSSQSTGDTNSNNNNNVNASQQPFSSSSSNHSSSKLSSSLEEVLRQNREYQSFLTKELGKLEQLLGINSEKRRLVEHLLEKLDTASSTIGGRGHNRQSSSSLPSSSSASSASHKLFLSQHGLDGPIPRKAIFASPFFVDAHGQTPPDNPDTIRKRRLRGAMPLVHKFIKWSREEKAQLMLGVKHQNQRFLMQKELEEVKNHFRQTGTLGDMNNAKLKEINTRIQALTPDEFVLDVEKIDWSLLSKKYVRSRSAIDCKIHWTGALDPRINHDPFTKEEESKLVQLANEKINNHSHNGSAAKNWIEIAAKLQTNRTAMQCFQRFQRSLNANLILSKWKPEEDKRLMEEVAKYGEKNWATVAAKMKMRTDQQCLHRWTKSVDPSIRSGRWTPQEDLRLRLAVKAYGAKNWNRIQLHIPGRTDVKCRERWTNVLDPGLSKDAWTDEEDQKLKELAIKYNNNWSKIAREMPTRTDNQCWRRWKKKVADRTQLEVRKRNLEKQTRMVKNFVGRPGERPILTADDVSEALGANAASAGATAATVPNASGATNAIAIARPAMMAVVPAVVPATNVTAAAASAAALGVALLPSLGLNVHHPNTVVGMSDLISFNKQVASAQQNQQQLQQKSMNDGNDQSGNNNNANNVAVSNAATTAAAAALANPVLNAAAVRAQAAGLFPMQQQQLLQMQLLLQPMGAAAAAAINQPFLNPLLAMAPNVAGANANTLAQFSQLMQQQQQQQLQLQQLQQVAQQQAAAAQQAAVQQQQQQQAQQQSNNRNAQSADEQNRDGPEQQTSAQQRRKERDHQQQQRRNEREREREREQAQRQQQQQQELSSLHLTHDDEGLHEGDELRAPSPHSPERVVDSIDVHGDGSSRAHVHSHSHQDQHAEHSHAQQNEDQGHHYHDDHSHAHDVNEYPELHPHHDSPDLLPSHPLHADHEDASSHLLHTMITDDEHPSFLPDQNAAHHHLHDSHPHGHSHHDSHSAHGDNHPDDRHHSQHHHSLHEDDENAPFDANEGYLDPLHFQGPQQPHEGEDDDSQQPQSDVGVGSKRKASQTQNARKRAKSNLNQDGSDQHYDQHDE